jgi:hypothetical protein
LLLDPFQDFQCAIPSRTSGAVGASEKVGGKLGKLPYSREQLLDTFIALGREKLERKTSSRTKIIAKPHPDFPQTVELSIEFLPSDPSGKGVSAT